MVETDYVVREITIKHSGIFDALEFFKLVKTWFKDNNYGVVEKDYDSSLKEFKNAKIKMEGKKKVDSYTKFVISFKTKFADMEDVEVKGKKMQKGKIEFSVESALEKDYEDTFENNPLRRFFSGIFDKFIGGEKYDRYSSELKGETYELFNHVKAFLNLYKL